MRPAKQSVVVRATDYHEEGVDPRWADMEEAPRYAPGGKKKNKEQKDACRWLPPVLWTCRVSTGMRKPGELNAMLCDSELEDTHVCVDLCWEKPIKGRSL